MTRTTTAAEKEMLARPSPHFASDTLEYGKHIPMERLALKRRLTARQVRILRQIEQGQIKGRLLMNGWADVRVFTDMHENFVPQKDIQGFWRKRLVKVEYDVNRRDMLAVSITKFGEDTLRQHALPSPEGV